MSGWQLYQTCKETCFLLAKCLHNFLFSNWFIVLAELYYTAFLTAFLMVSYICLLVTNQNQFSKYLDSSSQELHTNSYNVSDWFDNWYLICFDQSASSYQGVNFIHIIHQTKIQFYFTLRLKTSDLGWTNLSEYILPKSIERNQPLLTIQPSNNL